MHFSCLWHKNHESFKINLFFVVLYATVIDDASVSKLLARIEIPGKRNLIYKKPIDSRSRILKLSSF